MMKNRNEDINNTSNEIIERADFLEIENFEKQTVYDDQHFIEINNALLDKGTILLQGPRGCGKTHLMRYTWFLCQNDNEKPLALYVSFNKYFWLEPLLKTKPNAISLFNTWCLTKILISAHEVLETLKSEDLKSNILIAKKNQLEDIVTRLEQGLAPTTEQEIITSQISVSSVTKSLDELTKFIGRKRAIILLDDAAISLTPDYLYEFFDIVRTLKTSKIALKASVYPGTTEYGPKFHVNHEGKVVNAWLDIQNSDYSAILDKIAKVRFKNVNTIDSNIVELLKYASFGIPRAFLTMLRDYSLSDSNRNQQKFNQIVERFCEVKLSEYLSLKDKLSRLESIISTGAILFKQMIDKIKNANANVKYANKNTKQVILGVEEYQDPLASRMFQLLIEVGLIFPLTNISHGENRTYQRYIPHYAFLLNAKVFNKNSRGFNAKEILLYINRANEKHPVRTKLTSLLGNNYNLHLNLPACSQCATPRVNDSQKFCTHCGSQLVDESVFNKCMNIKLNEVPGLTEWQQVRIESLNTKNVGEFLTLPDPGSELRKIPNIGRRRAETIIDKIRLHVDEYLS
ncbi:hypothetical protein GASC598I20_022930 [Gilliamella apicola SCGC AB-598-I20]|nr:hypothetical protein GASC598I20_022930 [Gilliamella apicola SCGC AB-598-I20]